MTEPTTGLIAIFGAIFSMFVGMIGWSYRRIIHRLDTLDREVSKRPTHYTMHEYVGDRLAPHLVEFSHLAEDMAELKQTFKELDKKLDKLLILCAHGKKTN